MSVGGPEGYRQEGYARSLREFGRPTELKNAGGWLLERSIPAAPVHRDAIGCYPFLACRDWNRLQADMDALRDELVTIAFVSDPFARFDASELAGGLDICTPFKTHMALDLSLPIDATVTKHHRYYARRALRTVEVEITTSPHRFAREWSGLYEHLVDRHQIEGIRSFSDQSFEEQLGLDGMIMARALEAGETVAAILWMTQDDVAYAHLAASTPRGYELSASYALYDQSIRYFVGKAAWLSIGSSAGLSDSVEDGLTRFKRGWTSEARTAYFCGKILQPEIYRDLALGAGSGFFPAYRTAL